MCAVLSESTIYMPGSKDSMHCDHIGGLFIFTSLSSGLIIHQLCREHFHVPATVLVARNTIVQNQQWCWSHTGVS